MPAVLPPAGQWLADQISGLKRDVASLKAPRTEFVVDPAGVCQFIKGNLAADHQGNSTGLGSVWGAASFKTGSWVRL